MTGCSSGHLIGAGESVCARCGAIVVSIDDTPPPQPTSAPPPPPPAAPMPHPTSPQPTPAPPRPPPRRSRRSRRGAVLAVTVAVVVVGAGTVAVLVARSGTGADRSRPLAATPVSSAPLPLSPLAVVAEGDPCNGHVVPGHQIVGVGSEFEPGATTTLSLGTSESDPNVLGDVEADGDGVAVASFLVPDLPEGDLVAVRLEGAAGGGALRAQTGYLQVDGAGSPCAQAAVNDGQVASIDPGSPAAAAPNAAQAPQVPPPLAAPADAGSGTESGFGIVGAASVLALVGVERRRRGRGERHVAGGHPSGGPPVLIVGALVVLLVAAAVPPAGAQDGADYVALGDSYSSGEGVTPFGSGQLDVACHRSGQAYARLLESSTTVDIATLRFSACTGATTADVVRPEGSTANGQALPGRTRNPLQIDSVTSDTDLVTLTLGGNDLGFADIVPFCAMTRCLRNHYPNDQSTTLLPDWIDQQRPRVVAAVGDVLDAILDQADPPPTVVLAGYPELFAPDPGARCPESYLFERAERVAINEAIDDFNAALQQVASVEGAQFAPVTPAFNGYRVCERGSASEEYLTGIEVAFSQIFRGDLGFGWDGVHVPPPVGQASFHPTAAGQRAYASAIEATLDHIGFQEAPAPAPNPAGGGSTPAGVSPEAVDLVLPPDAVGLTSADWSPEDADLHDMVPESCDDLPPELDAGVRSVAEAGSTGAGDISQRVAVFASEEAAQTAFDAIASSLDSCDYSPSGPITVASGEATTFMDASSDGIEHVVGRVGTVVWDVSFYGAYDDDELAAAAAGRIAAGGGP